VGQGAAPPLRHSGKDMRVPRAVLFDYGRTLVEFDYPERELLEAMREALPLLGPGAPAAEVVMRDVLRPLEAELETFGEDEVDYLKVYERAWRRVGVQAPRDVLYQVLDREQRVWDRHVRPAPDALTTLHALRGRGLRTAIVSNAPFPPEMMRRQMAGLGFLAAVDAVVLSAEIVRRVVERRYGSQYTARGIVTCKRETLDQVRVGTTPKGAVIQAAELAGRVIRDAPGPAPAGLHHIYRPRPRRVVTNDVVREGDGFRVSGDVVERMVRRIDLDNEEAVARLQRKLAAAGVDAALAAAGCREGDTVLIGDAEFVYRDDGLSA